MDRLREMLRRLKEELDSDSRSDGGSSSNSSSSSSSSSVSLSSSSSCVSDSDSDRDEVPPSRATCSFEDLKKQMETMLEEPERPLRPGDVVVWKDGCQNRKRPKLGEFAVVARVLDHPVFGDESSSGSPYFREPLDLVLMMLDSDGDAAFYYFDKRRFRLAAYSEDPSQFVTTGQKMRNIALEFNKPCKFAVGDAVMLKPGMRNRNVPNYSTVAVVVEVFDKPFRDTYSEEGTTSFYDIINGRIALLDSDGDIMFYHVDLRRYRKVN